MHPGRFAIGEDTGHSLISRLNKGGQGDCGIRPNTPEGSAGEVGLPGILQKVRQKR